MLWDMENLILRLQPLVFREENKIHVLFPSHGGEPIWDSAVHQHGGCRVAMTIYRSSLVQGGPSEPIVINGVN